MRAFYVILLNLIFVSGDFIEKVLKLGATRATTSLEYGWLSETFQKNAVVAVDRVGAACGNCRFYRIFDDIRMEKWYNKIVIEAGRRDAMRIYLDNCCFNRPYDDQTQIKLALETQAKLYIQDLVLNRKLDLIWSYVLEFENSKNTNEGKKNSILKWKALAVDTVTENNDIINLAKVIMSTGIKSYDALHVSCAISANCDVFLSVDKRLLNYQTDKIQVCNPIDFIMKYGDELK